MILILISWRKSVFKRVPLTETPFLRREPQFNMNSTPPKTIGKPLQVIKPKIINLENMLSRAWKPNWAQSNKTLRKSSEKKLTLKTRLLLTLLTQTSLNIAHRKEKTLGLFQITKDMRLCMGLRNKTTKWEEFSIWRRICLVQEITISSITLGLLISGQKNLRLRFSMKFIWEDQLLKRNIKNKKKILLKSLI